MLEVSEVTARKEFAGLDPIEGLELFYHTQEGDCVGYVDIHKEDDIAYIRGVHIDERVQGMGHGSRMMVEAMETLIALGYARAYLFVAAYNDPAIRVYEKAGFILESTYDTMTKLMHWELEV